MSCLQWENRFNFCKKTVKESGPDLVCVKRRPDLMELRSRARERKEGKGKKKKKKKRVPFRR